jgi:hypothetical protein
MITESAPSQETIEGPLPPTSGSPTGERLCWEVRTATLRGPRVQAELAMPGTDWIVPQFDVATGGYDWLRENVFIARGRLTGPRAIEYEIYRVG